LKEDEDEETDGDNFFSEQDAEDGDETITIKPWLGAIREPSGFIKPPLNYNKAPNTKLEIDHVYGYRVKDCRNNLRYLKNG